MKKHSIYQLWLRIILFMAIAIMLIFTLQVFILPLFRQIIPNGDALPLNLEINLIRMINGIVGVGLVYVFLSFDRQKFKDIGLKWNKQYGMEWILLSIPIALAGLIPTVIIEIIFNIIILKELINVLAIILTFFVTIFAIGLGEEILFRGYIQNMLETRYSFKFSAVLSALMFGFLHFWLAATSRNLFYMVAILFSAAVIGVTFSYVYKFTNYNLIFPIGLHGFWDFFLFIFQADFQYIDLLHVIVEILASTLGAVIIFYCVLRYVQKRNYFSQ